jgi:hypothetical protein
MSPSSTFRKLRVLLSRKLRTKARAVERHDANNNHPAPASSVPGKETLTTDVSSIDSVQPLGIATSEGHLTQPRPVLEYQPIGEHSVRLINLKPGSGDDPIECTLSIFDLDKVELKGAGPYETLSYVWGDSQKRGEILCDGAHMSVTRSLYDALKVLRYPTGCGSRMLW